MIQISYRDFAQHYLLTGIGLVLLYVITGKLGLMLAIGPGFASPIFPPAGVALAAALINGRRSWIWIFLGSFILNIWIASSANQNISLNGVMIAASIAFASLLQASLGAGLLKRLIPAPFALDHNRAILRFLLLLPCICLISASLSVGSLYGFGIVTNEQVIAHWASWWIGDLLGMLVFTIFTLSLAAQPAELWQYRLKTICPTLFITLAVFVVAYLQTVQWEYHQSLSDFRQYANQTSQQLNFKLLEQESQLEQLCQVFSVNQPSNTTQTFFKNFSHTALNRFHYIQALEWAPYISQAQRETFETTQQKLAQDFVIRERDQNKNMQIANQRAFYYPVTWVEPRLGNETERGFDLASNPQRLSAIHQAIQSGKIISSAPITLAQTQQGILLIQALSPGQAQSDIVLSVIQISTLFDHLMFDWKPHLYLRLTDVGTQTKMFDNFPDTQTPVLSQHTFSFGSRHYQLEAAPTPAYFAAHPRWQGWLVFSIGMIFISLLSAIFLLGTGYTNHFRNQVTERTRELAESKEYSNAILNNVSEGIITVSAQGLIVSCNDMALDMFAAEHTQLHNTPLHQLMPAPHCEQYADYFAHPAQLNHIIGKTCELTGLTLDQRKFPLELTLSQMLLGEKQFYNAVLRDITERKEVDRMKSEFISTVSHELRTPLTAINGSLSLLCNNVAGNIPPAILPMLTIAQRNSQRLILLVNDILDVEKIKSGKMEFNPTVVELVPLLQQTLENNRAYAEQYKVRYLLDTTLTTAQVYLDGNRLAQALTNLLANAAKFSAAGADVYLSLTRINQQLRITVTDHGSGIPDTFKKRIFKPFEQADSSDTRQKGGTGLGLNITKSIVEAMGGTLHFESEPHVKTQFHIEFAEYTAAPQP